ncbi:hypothetical protein BGZ52_006342 [Haplosporangium bisporale]|nr:hypothetical protein BGZ52_006342 [Haplosporangium bisporale]KFH67260.1 hypothetical protein MVEG_07782 [Podila verticillata NRRL 6337]
MDHHQTVFSSPLVQSPMSGASIMKAGDPTAAKNTSGLKTQIAISTFLGLAAFLMFCVLRTRWTTMFAPRTKLQRHQPPVLSSTFFGWIFQLLRIPEAEVMDCVGLDAVMMLRFFNMAMKMFAIFLVPALMVIAPVNHYSQKNGIPTIPDDGADDYYQPSNDDTEAVSFIVVFTQFTFTWVFSILTLYTIWHTYEGYIAIRREYMVKRAKSITNRTVMVVGLPTLLQNDRALATFYESLGVGMVESAHVCRHVRLLKKLIEQREHALRALEKVYTQYYGNPSGVPSYDPEFIYAENDRTLGNPRPSTDDHDHEDQTDENATLLRSSIPGKKRPTMRLGWMGLMGKKVDKIDHHREVFSTLDKAVQKMRMSRIFAKTSIGFVTFEEMSSAQILAQTVNTQETLSCITSLAPEPRDVFWDNLNIPPSELGVRSIVVNTTVFFLVFFWAGPVGLFSSFLNLESLEKLLPGITVIAEASPIIKSLIQGFLPTIGVTVFLAVVPKILEALSERQGIQAHSEVARSIYNKYFTFILFNVVLVFTIVGTWAQSINKVYHNIGELALILAQSLPRVAPFFVNYVILKGIGLLPLQLLQIGEVIEQTAKGFLSKTPRDYAESRAPPELKYGVVYSNATLMFVIVLIYSCIQPLILVFGVAYFAMGALVYKYQLLYVFFHPNESGGLTWPMVYNRITLGLMIFQTTMLGLLMLKKSFILGSLIVPLLVGTAWFWYWTTEAYKDSAKYIPLQILHPEGADNRHSGDISNPTPDSNVSGFQVGDQIAGHTLVDIEQESSVVPKTSTPIANGNSSGADSRSALTTSANAVISPGGSRRRIPKSVVDDDDYQAIPDRYTDYRQPPMTLFAGVLNSGMRHYNHPAIAGPLPTLWLPLKKASADGKNPQDEESAIGNHHHHPHLPGRRDSDSDDEHHEHALEAALAKPPLMLPTKGSDVPVTFDEGDNLVGGGQDEDLSSPAPASSSSAQLAIQPAAQSITQPIQPTAQPNAQPTTQLAQLAHPAPNATTSSNDAAPREPAIVSPRDITSKPTDSTAITSASVPIRSPVRGPQAADGNGANDDSSICTGGSSPVGSPLDESPLSETEGDSSKRQSAVDGIKDVYYHHPERRQSGSSVNNKSTPRTVQGQGSSANLLKSSTAPEPVPTGSSA